MNYCINLRKRKNKPFCKLLNKEIPFSRCRECDNKEYKTKNKENSFYKSNRTKKSKNSFCKSDIMISKKSTLERKSPHISGKMKRESSKHRKADKHRFSIIVSDLSKCCVSGCECTEGISKHEVFYEAYRHISIKWGLVIPLCPFHHTIGKFAIHNNREMDLYYKRLGQAFFEDKYSHKLFIKEFKINYLEIKEDY